MREDATREPDDIPRHGDAGIGLVGEDVHVVVSVSDKQVVLESPVNDCDLDDIGRGGELLDGDRAGA
jgi:hypothetical protein